MLSSLLMAAFVAQASEEGFSKLQIFMQQLIDWGRSRRSYYRGSYNLCGWAFPYFFH